MKPRQRRNPGNTTPDSAALHPGYLLFLQSQKCVNAWQCSGLLGGTGHGSRSRATYREHSHDGHDQQKIS